MLENKYDKTINMYKYLFGPVPSRRLGMSLGVDLVPKKVCSLNCVYCEVGETTKLTTQRKEYILVKNIISELDDYFKNNPDPDYFTFSGSGEPTLNKGIVEVLKYIKLHRPNIPIAILTNGTMFFDKEVKQAAMLADVILPSLDAATDEVFQKINRPADNLLIKKCIDELISFRKEYKGKIWLEVFILPGYNDSISELIELKKAILDINPDSIQLNTLDRPGTISNLRSATNKELQKIIDFWGIDNVEIIASAPERKKVKSYRADVESAILETIVRRPCTISDLEKILGMHVSEINKYLDVLDSDNKIEIVIQDRGLFYKVKD